MRSPRVLSVVVSLDRVAERELLGAAERAEGDAEGRGRAGSAGLSRVVARDWAGKSAVGGGEVLDVRGQE